MFCLVNWCSKDRFVALWSILPKQSYVICQYLCTEIIQWNQVVMKYYCEQYYLYFTAGCLTNWCFGSTWNIVSAQCALPVINGGSHYSLLYDLLRVRSAGRWGTILAYLSCFSHSVLSSSVFRLIIPQPPKLRNLLQQSSKQRCEFSVHKRPTALRWTFFCFFFIFIFNTR